MIHQLKNTGAQAILVHPSLAKTTLAAAKAVGIPSNRLFLFSDKPNTPAHSIEDWRNMIASPVEVENYQWKRMSEHEATTAVATVNYSSGTTGLPKGVCVSHYNLIANLEQTIYMRYLHKGFGPHNRPPERWVSRASATDS
jgi:4-coumarate--CoA ligase